jgi:hypothetical protein
MFDIQLTNQQTIGVLVLTVMASIYIGFGLTVLLVDRKAIKTSNQAAGIILFFQVIVFAFLMSLLLITEIIKIPG